MSPTATKTATKADLKKRQHERSFSVFDEFAVVGWAALAGRGLAKNGWLEERAEGWLRFRVQEASQCTGGWGI